MYETDADLAALQALLESSHAAGGRHLRSVITGERRMTAEQVVDRLAGMRLLVLATVTADGRPLVGPVDGIFYRGAFHFGSAPDSVRVRHLRVRPHVSATRLPAEEWAVTVHGRAVLVDVSRDGDTGFRRTLLEVYTPRYGDGWESVIDSGAVYARIEAEKMFTFQMTPEMMA